MAYSSSPTALWAGSPQTILQTDGVVEYSVRTADDDVQIYAGRAVSRPGESFVSVDIADIAADYCRQEMPAFEAVNLYGDPDAQLVKFNRPFIIRTTAADKTVNFLADWSYRNDAPRSRFLSDPVAAVLPANGVLIISDYYAPATTARISSGGTTLATITGLTAGTPYNLIFPLGSFSVSEVTVSCGGHNATFRVDGCMKAALYYVNAFGGWDCLPLDRIVRGMDHFQRESVALDFIPSRSDARSRRDFFVETSRTFQVRTHWLTDAQSERFSLNVPGTILASFFMDGHFYPVTIDDTEAAYNLTQSANGRVPVRHTLTLRLAQYRFRR